LKAGKAVFSITAFLLVVATAVFGAWMVSKYTGTQANVKFAEACMLVLVLVSPVVIYLATGRLRITKSVKEFGGMFNVIITTAVCTAIVIIVNIIANLSLPKAEQAEPWEIYTFYVVISIGEEVYYRLVLCWGILAMMSGKHRGIGVAGTVVVAALGLHGGFQVATTARATWIGVSILAFAAFYIISGRKEKEAPAWAIITAIAISAVTFSLCHWNVYHDYPAMLWATLIGGGTMATFLIYTKNIFVPFMAHFANNLMSLRGVVINASVLMAATAAAPSLPPAAAMIMVVLALIAAVVAFNSSFNRYIKVSSCIITKQE